MSTRQGELWQDPAAARWIAELLEKHAIVAKVQKALRARSDPDKPRMAAWLLLKFGWPGLWPAKALRADLEAACVALEKVIADDYGSAEFDDAIREEIDALKERLAKIAK